MDRGGWLPIDRDAVVFLPTDREYTKLEALISIQADYDRGNTASISGYSKLWSWSRKKVHNFLRKIGVEIIASGKKRSPHGGLIQPTCSEKKGQVGVQAGDKLVSRKEQVRFIDNKHLRRKRNMLDSEKGQAGDKLGNTTIHTNNKDKILTAKNRIFAGGAEEFYTSKKGRNLTGRVLESFDRFWDAFDYKKGKAEAADVWIDINYSQQQVQNILEGAKREASVRPAMLKNGRTPIMAQGWLSGRRWEDELERFAEKQGEPEWK